MTRALPLPHRRTRWTLFGMFFALTLLASIGNAQETEEEKCSDFTENNRPCTATEELAYCTINAIESLDECREDLPWYKEGGCWILYLVDFIACSVEFPLGIAGNALK